MTESQIAFVKLDKKKTECKKIFEKYKESIQSLVDEMGVGGNFQDDDGTVYLIDECEGKFVYFDNFEVKRTRREDETRGSLSIKKAKELGYEL